MTQQERRLEAVLGRDEERALGPLTQDECDGLRAQERGRLAVKRELRARGVPDIPRLSTLCDRLPRVQPTAPVSATLAEVAMHVLIALLVFAVVGGLALQFSGPVQALASRLPTP